jgi:hypothetical protein
MTPHTLCVSVVNNIASLNTRHNAPKKKRRTPQLIGRQYSTSMLYVRIDGVTGVKKHQPRTNLIGTCTKYVFPVPVTYKTQKKYVPPVRVVIIHQTTNKAHHHTTTTPHQKNKSTIQNVLY